jgi:hypothetical protein
MPHGPGDCCAPRSASRGTPSAPTCRGARRRWRSSPPAAPVSLLVTTAKDEAGSSGYADSRRFLVLAHTAGAPLRVDSLILDHGGHNFSTWNVELPPRALSWLTQRLPGPAPVG